MTILFYVIYPFKEPKDGSPRKGREGPYELQKALDRRVEIGKSIGMEKPYLEPKDASQN
jgi:hypothetical protein